MKPKIDPHQVMELYRLTGMPIIACRDALVEAEGDMNGAIELFRQRLRRSISPPHPLDFWERFQEHLESEQSDDSPSPESTEC